MSVLRFSLRVTNIPILTYDQFTPRTTEGQSVRRLEMLFLPAAAALINTERRWSRRFWVVLGVSVVLHALLFIFLPALIKQDPEAAASGPLTVQLQTTPAAPAEIVESRPPAPARPPPRMMTAPARSPQTASVPLPPPVAPEPDRTRPPVPAQANDFASVLEARRTQRLAYEAALARANAEASAADRGGEGANAGAANALRNLSTLANPRSGTGGVFEILDKGHRRAQFAFNGWTPSASNRWREVIEVDAGPLGDIDRAIVRRMIELIRKYHSGSFNWESHRLGRVVKLSARIEDNDGLEEFMMLEFFGQPRQR